MQKVLFNELEKLLKEEPHKYFLMFSTTWCPDCTFMKHIIKNVETEINGRLEMGIEFIEIDAEEADLFRKKPASWEVLKVPSFFIVKGDKRKHIGYEYLPFDKIVQELKNYFS